MISQPHRHRIVTRYAECDGQGVVFNAHYLTYCDDAFDWWLRSTFGVGWKEAIGWEFVLKRTEIEWDAPARAGERLDMVVEVARWGTTSFVVEFSGAVGERSIFVARHTYVGVETGTHRPIPVPEVVRAALGGPND